jgi:hypothetical protein
MGPRAKLERLEHAWLVYAVCVALLELFRDGLSSDALVAAAIRIGLTYGFAWYLTKELAGKSSLVWAFGVVFTLIATVTAGIEIVEILVDASEGRGIAVFRLLLAAGSGCMNVYTFRVLRDREVKRHVMSD